MKTAKKLLCESVNACGRLNGLIEDCGLVPEDALRLHMDVYIQFERIAWPFITGQPGNINDVIGSIDALIESFENVVRMVKGDPYVARVEDDAYEALNAAYLYVVEGVANENR